MGKERAATSKQIALSINRETSKTSSRRKKVNKLTFQKIRKLPRHVGKERAVKSKQIALSINRETSKTSSGRKKVNKLTCRKIRKLPRHVGKERAVKSQQIALPINRETSKTSSRRKSNKSKRIPQLISCYLTQFSSHIFYKSPQFFTP